MTPPRAQRWFNTTGPCNPEDHYMLPPEARLPDLLPYVQQKLYFVVHAARQTGKTTAMRAFAARLREAGYAAVWATLETSQEMSEVERAEPLWVHILVDAASYSLPPEQRPPTPPDAPTGSLLYSFLRAWSSQLTVPLVLLLDEADTVSGPALVSLLRQLRAGFTDRGVGRFPVSIGLIGMRDLRETLTQTKDGTPVNPGSPFNVKKASLTLRNFTREEVATLYRQHTDATGQSFTEGALDRAFYWSEGQPFLVNALADICIRELAPEGRDVTADLINEAKERLLVSRTTHLDSLGQRLREERVATVVQAILLGDQAIDYGGDDYLYAVDLGLVADDRSGARIANPLYREVLARELSYNQQRNLPAPWWRWSKPDGRLDFPALVEAFLGWWREHEGAARSQGSQAYTEALPHLTFMAFLQRVVNGGGTVHREYAAGRGAVDLVVFYGSERFVVELKRVFTGGRSRDKVREEGVRQLSGYLDTLGAQEGWLILFDQRPGRGWRDRLWAEDREVAGKVLRLRGA